MLALITSLEPDVTIRIIPEATRTNYSTNTASKSGADRVKSNPPVRIDEVQTAHVAVFATACNARPRSNNELHDDAMEPGLNDDMNIEDMIPTDIEEKLATDPDGTISFFLLYIIDAYLSRLGGDFDQILKDLAMAPGETGDAGDDDGKLELNHQPLAVALWISAAIMPSGMPNWFGPLNRNEPTAVRIALHIQVREYSLRYYKPSVIRNLN